MDELSPTSPISRFTVSPSQANVFYFPTTKSTMDPEQNLPQSPSTSSFVKNPLFVPEPESVILNPTTLESPPRPNSLFGLTNHQESLFDIQLDEFIKKSQTTSQYDEWDKAVTSPENDRDQMGYSEWPIQFLKIIVYNVTFILIIFLAVTSKCITLLMTSMIYANREIQICNSNESTRTIDPPVEFGKKYSVRYEEHSVHRIAWLWCLYGATITPWLFVFGRSVRICCFRKFAIPQTRTVVTVFIMETLHVLGLAMLIFIILPNFDVVRGAMMLSSVCTVPSFIRLFVNPQPQPDSKFSESKKKISRKLGFTSSCYIAWFTFALQLISLAAWTVMDHYEAITGRYHLLPICLILVSFEWWENYLVPNQMWKFLSVLDETRKDLQTSRYFISLFISLWKCLLLFILMILHEFIIYDGKVALMMFSNFTDGFSDDQIKVFANDYVEPDTNNVPIFGPYIMDNGIHYIQRTNPLIPMYFMLSHIAITLACYWMAKYVCQICIQKVSFAIPVTLTIPITVAILWEFTKLSQSDKCSLVHRFPLFQYIFWYGHLDSTFVFPDETNGDWLYIFVAAIWFLGTQFANTVHIWKVNSERLATSDQLFVSPKYNSVLIDQSLALNRRCLKIAFTGDEKGEDEDEEEVVPVAGLPYLGRRPTQAEIEYAEFQVMQMKQEEDWEREWKEICADHGLDEDGIDPKPNPKDDDTVRIYACATMWHEDKNEMLQMLKAVIRLDFDQGVKRIAKEHYGETDQYYELEVNIFFDNAFEQGLSKDDDDRMINKFVEQLIDVINVAATQVLGTMKVIIEYPTIIPTPFGGKLVWKLPGGNRLIAHVKDKLLIRDRKRWSQCMYMYYLLAHRLAARKDLNWLRKQKIANNTFILALDGDINFQPSAVHMVVDLMKKNLKLGAACGRIHPIGSGMMVWYQKFEYGIGHWFQKATEHVFGCVLCSPGCFSLFRARALMDDSVMHKYTTKSTEALHYVQYDQGEDRWLCTLLLQRGWRIEYCAASDSFTHAPEGFGEFYTQRRRWAPSTMANVIDLLSHFRTTVQCNENVSRLYILYQAFLMFGSLLSPATITLMIVTAMNTAMNMDLTFSIYINLIVILIYTFVCYYVDNSKNYIKINFAMILSTVYALLMLAVLVGTAIEMVKQGVFSPNSLFFTAMLASFLLAAILHPHEFACVFLFPIYMLLIPSMYLLLTIYSVTNMHIVSWGTREVKENLTDEELAEAEEEAKAKLQKKSKTRELLQYIDPRKYGSGVLNCMCCSVGTGSRHGMLNCMCCSGGGNQVVPNGTHLQELQENVTELKTVITQIQSQIPEMIQQNFVSFKPESEIPETPGFTKPKTVEFEAPEPPGASVISETGTEFFEEIPMEETTPRWILNHPQLRLFKRKSLHDRERQFWVGLIDKYLYPIKPDRKEQQKIESELLTLRNKALFAMGFLNILVVLLFFILQSHEDLRLIIPIGSQKIEMHPIGFWLVLFFGTLLFIQCIGMIIHRFATITHLLAYTVINFSKKQETIVTLVKKVIYMNARNQVNMLANGESPPSTIREESVEELKQRRKSGNIKLDDMFKKQIKMLKREASHLSSPNSQIDINEFSRLSTKAVSKRTISLPPQHRNPPTQNSVEVVVDNQNQAPEEETSNLEQPFYRVPLTATRSLKIRSKKYLDRFTGSIRHLRNRAWSFIPQQASDA